MKRQTNTVEREDFGSQRRRMRVKKKRSRQKRVLAWLHQNRYVNVESVT